MTQDDTSLISEKANLQIENNRLPCRGCTKNCNDYNRCNGTPWRLDITDVDSAPIKPD